MPFVLLIAGAVLLIAAVRNTQDNLFSLLKGDFTGQANFVYWVFSLLVIGSFGYIPKLKPVSIAFLTLVILVLVLTRGNPQGVGGGLFSKLTAQLGTTTGTTSATSAAIAPLNSLPTSTAGNPNLLSPSQLSGLVNLIPIQ
jgi:hypothetical protein